jgi:hypothetical protein
MMITALPTTRVVEGPGGLSVGKRITTLWAMSRNVDVLSGVDVKETAHLWRILLHGGTLDGSLDCPCVSSGRQLPSDAKWV